MSVLPVLVCIELTAEFLAKIIEGGGQDGGFERGLAKWGDASYTKYSPVLSAGETSDSGKDARLPTHTRTCSM